MVMVNTHHLKERDRDGTRNISTSTLWSNKSQIFRDLDQRYLDNDPTHGLEMDLPDGAKRASWKR